MNEMFQPHGYCIAWDSWILWEDILSNTAIFIAYMWIPYRVYKTREQFRDRKYSTSALVALGLVVAFVLTCGFTHLMDIITMFLPWWRIDAHLRSLCAAISILAMVKIDIISREEAKFKSFEDYEKIREEAEKGRKIITELIEQNKELQLRLRK